MAKLFLMGLYYDEETGGYKKGTVKGIRSGRKRLEEILPSSFVRITGKNKSRCLSEKSGWSEQVPVIRGFAEGCPLESAAGLQEGDRILSIDGERIYTFSDVSLLLGRNKTGDF